MCGVAGVPFMCGVAGVPVMCGVAGVPFMCVVIVSVPIGCSVELDPLGTGPTGGEEKKIIFTIIKQPYYL